MVGGEWFLTTAQLGPNLFIGNNARANGLYAPLRWGRGDPRLERQDATKLAEAAEGRRLTPGEVSRHWTARTLADVRAEPVREIPVDRGPQRRMEARAHLERRRADRFGGP